MAWDFAKISSLKTNVILKVTDITRAQYLNGANNVNLNLGHGQM